MESALRECLRSVRIGKVLVQRNEETGEARLYYAKLPEDIHERFVLLLDPMLATGGSAIRAIEVLLSKGVKQDKIVFLNVLSAPEGLKVMYEKYPKMKVSDWYFICISLTCSRSLLDGSTESSTNVITSFQVWVTLVIGRCVFYQSD